jgi:S1-C subfamily serine protease
MIPEAVIQRLWRSTCSVVRLSDRFSELVQRYDETQLHDPPIASVVATGFMVSEKEMLTNFHVLEDLLKDHQENGHHENWVVRFTYPRPDTGTCSSLTAQVLNVYGIPTPKYDVALMEIHTNQMESNSVEFGDLDLLSLGKEVGICGFPAGNVLLSNPLLGLNRYGPLVFKGIVSGVAPFPHPDKRKLTRLVTDISSFGGFSGSPVFNPTDGSVIGLHHAGLESTCGIALPIDRRRVDSWLRAFHESHETGKHGICRTRHMMRFAEGGDFLGWRTD